MMSKLSMTRKACARIPPAYGDFQLCYYRNTQGNKEHLALYTGDPTSAGPVLVQGYLLTTAQRMDHLLPLKSLPLKALSANPATRESIAGKPVSGG